MSTNPLEGQVQGDPAPELLDGRMWVDGCFDFFHHGTSPIEWKQASI
jgi:ethanolamine-phosphate cytidylyltransferase